jgi:hypothetical protein
MTKTIIVMENNWLFDINRVLEFNNIDLHKLLSLHAEYYPKANETHIVIYISD